MSERKPIGITVPYRKVKQSMTHQEIKELAGHRAVPPWVMKLVSDAVAKEREACAKVCEGIFYAPEPEGCGGDEYYYTKPYLHCAEAIRARGEA